MSGLVKWLSGISATVLAAVIIFLLTGPDGFFSSDDEPTPRAEPSPDSGLGLSPEDCFLAGQVFTAANEPISRAAIGYLDDGFVFLAATGSDGSYQAGCNQVEDGKFPLVLRLSHEDWGGCVLAPANFRQVEKGTFNPLNLQTPSQVTCFERIPPDVLRSLIQSPVQFELIRATPVPSPVVFDPGEILLNPDILTDDLLRDLTAE